MSHTPIIETVENVEDIEENYKFVKIENNFNNIRGSKYFDDKRLKPS